MKETHPKSTIFLSSVDFGNNDLTPHHFLHVGTSHQNWVINMIVHLRNPAAYWRLVLTVLLLFILLAGYFVRNPTSMTKNKIRLRDSCLDPMMIPGEEKHQQKLSLEFFVLHREKLLNLGKQECKIVSPIIDQIFDLELSSSRSLVINDKSFKAKVKLKHQYWRITTIIELRLQIH